MTRIFARACLTSNEVYALLEAGHWHGAFARARTLHELDVVSLTLALHPELAEPYLLHIDRWKFAQDQDPVLLAGGHPGVSLEGLDSLRNTSENSCNGLAPATGIRGAGHRRS